MAAKQSAGGGGFVDGLKKVLSQVAQLATEPDADVNFAAQLQGMIVSFIKQGMPGPPGAGGGQGGPPGGAPPGAGGPPPPGNSGGAMPGLNPGQPASDELSRLIGGGGGIG